ncbi:Protein DETOXIFICATION [Rhynchospora pubera]|uniref:Protein DETOXIFICATION n=1 Tax=Rhynchospora pubera TaxID=906938 RepID=A0AAV8DZ22_9POAL|nr:Protein DETOXIFICATION [Rhynchospora pubera]
MSNQTSHDGKSKERIVIITIPEMALLEPQKEDGSVSQYVTEAWSILGLSTPMILTGLIMYLRSMISMLFLGQLGGLALAGGSLAIGFANITGYSVLSGLAMGMEPICGQAFGAKRHGLLGLALQRTVLLLLCVSIPVALLWTYMKPILILCGQEEDIASAAHIFILYSLPDLLLQSFIHPLRIYLRTQSINFPLTFCAMLAIFLHFPINYLFVSVLNLGIKGVALASVCANLNLVIFLLTYTYFSGVHKLTGGFEITKECLRGWGSLLALSVPSAISVCLEWWWYEIMIILCGLLSNPQATVASMGILIQTTSLIYIFPSSLSFGVSTRVGNELGANRPSYAKRAATVGIILSFILGSIACSFATSVRYSWARMFTNDADILKLTATVLPILGLCELGNCPQTTGCGVLRGSARPKIGANVNLGSFYVVGMPVAVGLAFCFGLDFKGLWLGLLSAQLTCVVLMLVVIKSTNWELQAERALKLTGACPGDEIDEECGDTISKQQTQKMQKTAAIDGDEKSNLVINVKDDQSTD